MSEFKKTLTAHMMLCNEERWCWYAIMSVIDHVDHMIIFDTGSTDRTVEIVKGILAEPRYAKKIIFDTKGKVDRLQFVQLRNEMVQRTTDDFFIVIDGDEVYYEKQLLDIRKKIDFEENCPAGLVCFVNCAGDVKHYRNPLEEHYRHGDRVGAITQRVFSMAIEGIHCGNDDGTWDGYYDGKGCPVTVDKGFEHFLCDGFYLHMSNMLRSDNRASDNSVGWPSNRKSKYINRSTYDHAFGKDFPYPEAFYLKHPENVKDCWMADPGLRRMLTQLVKNIVRFNSKDEIINKWDSSYCYRKVNNNE